MISNPEGNQWTSKLRIGKLNAKMAAGIAILGLLATISVLYFTLSAIGEEAESEERIELLDNSDEASDKDSSGKSSENTATTSSENLAEASFSYVHVTGCVKNPGLYALASDARINDAVISAGGFTSSADEQSVNLAEQIVDGQQIVILKKSSGASASGSGDQTSQAQSSGSVSKNSNSDTASSASGSKININTASSSELQQLSGIGEAKAQKIIDHREQNGPFSKIEELTEVSGIGDKTLESIKDDICV